MCGLFYLMKFFEIVIIIFYRIYTVCCNWKFVRMAKARIKETFGKYSPDDPIKADARGELEIYKVKNKFNYEIYDAKSGKIIDQQFRQFPKMEVAR